jgi:hypothetical protein
MHFSKIYLGQEWFIDKNENRGYYPRLYKGFESPWGY